MSEIITGLKYEEQGLTVFSPVKFFIRTFESEKVIRLHYHRSLEINVCRNVDGIIRLGGREYSLARDCVIILPPDTPHSYRFRSSPGSVEVFHFMIEALQGAVQALGDNLSAGIKPLGGCTDESVRQLDYFRRGGADGGASRLHQSGALLILISELAVPESIHRPAASGCASDDFLYRVIAYTEKNYSGRVGLDDVSRHAGISKYHFCRVFRKAAGESWSQYLRAVRISNSLLLLKKGFSVVDTASACGFESDSYFIKCFRTEFSMTPLQWVRSSKQENI